MSSSISRSTSPSADRHPSLGTLLLFLEGELDQRTKAKVEGHINECWLCRTQCEHLRKGRSKFVDYWQECLIPNVPMPPTRKAEMRRTLRNRMLASEKVTRSAPLYWLIGMASAAAIGFLLLVPLDSSPSVSASKFLGEASVASTRILAPPSGHVIRQQFTFQQGEMQIQSTIWRGRGTENGSLAEPEDGTFRQSLEASGINWRDPMNPLDFIKWRNSQAIAHEDVTESAEYLTLYTTVESNQSVRTVALTVNRSTWQPVARSAEFFDAPPLRVREIDFTIEPASESEATPSTDPMRISRSTPVVPALRKKPRPVVDRVVLEEAELTLRELFHEAGVDVREAPEVWQEAGQVHFRFADGHPERLQSLTARAIQIPFTTASPEPIPSAARGETRNIGISSITEPPLAKVLSKYFGGLERANTYLDNLRDNYLRAFQESTAMDRLYARYSEGAMDALSMQQQLRVEAMAENHAVRLRAESRQYLALLSPVLDYAMESEGIPFADLAGKVDDACLIPRDARKTMTSDLQALQRNFRLLFLSEQVETPEPLEAKLLLRRARDSRASMQTNLKRLCLSR